jgi:hypothetical protein
MENKKHIERELTEPNLADYEVKKMNLGGKGFKSLSKQFVNVMLNEFFINNGYNITDRTVLIECKNEKEATNKLNLIGLEISSFMNKFIEQSFKESAKNYYRNIILYESKIVNNNLVLQW